jgi:hypothetical protein
MARTTATNFTGPLQYPIATAATDIFKKEDLQTLAQAVDQHDHTAGKGLSVAPANASITNAKLASDTARANLLTNGSFDVWQRGNGPFVCNGGGVVSSTCDRWAPQLATGAGNITVTRETATVDAGSSASAKVVYTAGAGDATVNAFQQQATSGDIISQLRGRTVSFSARVNVSAIGRVRLFYYDGVSGSGARINAPAYNLTANAWETLTFTFPVAAGATAFYVGVDILLGSTTTFYADNAMLVVGSVPSDYAPLHPADDLARCLRYYETLNSDFFLQGYASVANQDNGIPAVCKQMKPVTPTVTIAGTWALLNTTGATTNTPTVSGVSLVVRAAAIGAFYARAATNGLVFEANP